MSFFKGIGEKFRNMMLAPGARDPYDGHFDDEDTYGEYDYDDRYHDDIDVHYSSRRDRDRGRDSSRDRDRDRDYRDRGRDSRDSDYRDRDRDRDYRDRDSRERDYSRDSRESRDRDYSRDRDDYESQPPRSRSSSGGSGGGRGSGVGRAPDNIVKINSKGDIPPSTYAIISHPKVVEDAVALADHVCGGMLCIVDLTGLEEIEAQRIADYLGGVCQALDGTTTRVNNGIFTVSPSNFRVMPAYSDSDVTQEDTLFSQRTAR